MVKDDKELLEEVTLENSSQILYVHVSANCHGSRCSIHNRSNHNMRTFPQHFRFDRGIMERICPHGIGHPDPDDINIILGYDSGVHGCDGCCKGNRL